MIHPDRLIRPPQQPTPAEGSEQRHAIDQLRCRARETEFVHEPVDIQKRGGQFVEDKIEAVVIAERSLCQKSDKSA